MISEARYIDSAKELNVEVAAIKAVALIEGNGAGFLQSGEPVILFEPHIFWRELVKRKIDPAAVLTAHPDMKDLLYQKWKPGAYGPANTQHARLQRAVTIHREAALASCSWGAFQILGQNYQSCGCSSIQEFVTAMFKDTDEHLRLFCNFLKNTGLDKALRAKKWDVFAEGYNGKGYKEHNYDGRLATAYNTYKNIYLNKAKNTNS